MTWTRLDDTWTDRADLAELDHAARWHYLALIQFCSRTGRYDGRVRMADARRCSDVADADAAHSDLARVGLVTLSTGALVLEKIAEHIPPPSVREDAERARVRKERSRRHRNGDHSGCYRQRCEHGPLDEPTPTRTRVTPGHTPPPASHVTGPGRETIDPDTGEVLTSHEPDDWPEVAAPAAPPPTASGTIRQATATPTASGHMSPVSHVTPGRDGTGREAVTGKHSTKRDREAISPTNPTASGTVPRATTRTPTPRPCQCGALITTPNRVRCPECMAAVFGGSR